MQVLLRLEEQNPRPPLSTGSAAKAREDLLRSVRAVEGPLRDRMNVSDTTLAGAGEPLRARLYDAGDGADGPPGALIVYYHGGGWVCGDLESHDRPCRMLARASGAR